jgi:hypothetical protein
MSKQSFKVEKSIRIKPVDLSTLTNPENGELAIDSSDSNKLKKYNETTSAWELIEGSGSLPANAVLTTAVQTLTNKSLVDSSTAIVDATDSTKQLKFDAAGTTATSTTLATSQTANRILTLPDTTGTLISSADVGTVTSTMIADGTIVNADISSTAAIALSKLATGALPSAITVDSSNIVDGSIVNADISATAAIADTKLATISTAGKVANSATTATSTNTASTIVARDASGNFSAGTITASLNGNASTVTTNANLTGPVTSVGNATSIGTGVITSTMIADGTIVDGDISSSAAISLSKLATGALPSAITVSSANIVDGTIVDADVSATAAIALSKLATGALPSGITVNSSNIVDGSIVDADVSATAAIALSKLATGALPTAITVASANIVDGTIVDADINASAAIVDTKLATISTAGKVLNSATTATSSNTASAIVARDASGNFSAGTITANLNGNASTVTTNANLTGDVTSVGNATTISNNAVTTGKILDGAVTSAKIADGTIVNTDISPTAAIDLSKLATGALPSGITVSSANITDGTIVNADVSPTAAIDLSKLATGALPTGITVASANIVDGTIVNTDISPTAAIALSKLATGALPSAITVDSSNITDGSIVNADISPTAAIALSKLATGALPSAITVDSSNIVNGSIVDADVSSTAAISLSKLATGALPSGITINSSNITDGSIVDDDISATAAINASKIANGSVSNTEFQYLDGVTSSIQTQLNGKEPTVTAGTISQYYRGDKTWQTLNLPALSDVSLSTLSDGQVLTYNSTLGKWQNATPSGGGSSVKEIHEYATINSFPATGAAENIYVAQDTNNLYRWDSATSSYIQEATTANSILTEVYNESGSTISKMSVVYLSGPHGNTPIAQLAQADSEIHSALTYGLVVSDIADMSRGYVVELGRLENLNTNVTGWEEGDILYLSSSTAGGVTNVKPSAPSHMVIVGTLIRKHPTQGVIQVKVQNGYELGELHNVSLSSPPTNGDYLVYESATSLWKNSTLDLSGYIKKDGSVAMEANLSMGSTPHKLVNLANGTANNDAVNLSQLKDPTNITQDSTHRFVSDTQISTWDAKQNALGYTPENVANKVTDLTSPSNTTYPTTQAVSTALSGKFDTPTGTSSQYIKGDGTLGTLPEGTTAAWGTITGTLSSQTDLQNALNLKENSANKVTDFTTVDNTKYPTTQAVSTELAKKRDIYISGQNTADLTHWTTNDICRVRQTKKITGLDFNSIIYYEYITRSLNCSTSDDHHTKLVISVKGTVNSNAACAMFIKDVHICDGVMVSYQDSFTSQNASSLVADLHCTVSYQNDTFILGFICQQSEIMTSCTVSVFIEEEQF